MILRLNTQWSRGPQMTTYYIRSLQNVFLMDCVKSSDKIPRGSNVVAAALVIFLFGCLFCFKEGHVYLQNLLRILRSSGDIN